MDYRELLKKYMRHVDSEEGYDYLNWIPPHAGITEEEEKELKTIKAELEEVSKT